MKRIVLLSITLVASVFLATQRDTAAQTGNLNAELQKELRELASELGVKNPS